MFAKINSTGDVWIILNPYFESPISASIVVAGILLNSKIKIMAKVKDYFYDLDAVNLSILISVNEE